MSRKRTSFRVTLGGKKWTIRIVPSLKGSWGRCTYDDRLIEIGRDTIEQGRGNEVLLHECLHALFYWMDEETVDKAAVELDDVQDVLEF